MKVLISILVVICVLISCKSKLDDGCDKIKMYQPINLIFTDSIKFSNESIDKIEFRILGENQISQLTKPVQRKLYEKKKIYHFELNDSIDDRTSIELKLSDRIIEFSSFDFGKAEIETMFGSSYETCLLRGCMINGNYEKTPFQIKIE